MKSGGEVNVVVKLRARQVWVDGWGVKGGRRGWEGCRGAGRGAAKSPFRIKLPRAKKRPPPPPPTKLIITRPWKISSKGFSSLIISPKKDPSSVVNLTEEMFHIYTFINLSDIRYNKRLFFEQFKWEKSQVISGEFSAFCSHFDYGVHANRILNGETPTESIRTYTLGNRKTQLFARNFTKTQTKGILSSLRGGQIRAR